MFININLVSRTALNLINYVAAESGPRKGSWRYSPIHCDSSGIILIYGFYSYLVIYLMLIYLDLSGYKSLRCCNNFRASRPKEVSYHVLGRKLDTKLYRKQKIIITRGSFQQPTNLTIFIRRLGYFLGSRVGIRQRTVVIIKK